MCRPASTRRYASAPAISAVHFRNDGRRGIEIHDFAERDDAAAAEIASKQFERRPGVLHRPLRARAPAAAPAAAGTRTPPARALRPSRRRCRIGCSAAPQASRRMSSRSCGHHAPSLSTDPPDDGGQHQHGRDECSAEQPERAVENRLGLACALPCGEAPPRADRAGSVPRRGCCRARPQSASCGS